jgi:hypothetical protein
MPYSNISAELTAAQITSAISAINGLKTLMPFLINLTMEERQNFSKMGDDGFSYVTKAIDYAKANPTVIPAALNVTEAAKDLKLYNDLRGIFQQLSQLRESIDDTMMALGVEAKDFSDLFYNLAKGMASANVPGMDTIADDLGEFYAKANAAPPPTP